MRKGDRRLRIAASGVGAWLVNLSVAHALYLDPERDVQVTGKVSSQVSIRTTGPMITTGNCRMIAAMGIAATIAAGQISGNAAAM